MGKLRLLLSLFMLRYVAGAQSHLEGVSVCDVTKFASSE